MRDGDEQLSSFEKFTLLIGGFVVPWFCYPIVIHQENLRELVHASEPASSPWLASIDEILISPALRYTFPLVIVLYAAFWSLVINVSKHGNNLWLRLGLATGLPIVLNFHLVLQARLRLTVVEAIAFHGVWLTAGVLCWMVGTQSFRRLRKRSRAITTSTAFTLTVILVTSIASILFFTKSDRWINLSQPSLLVLHGVFLPSSLIWFAAIVRLIMRVRFFYPLKSNFSLAYLIGWTTWLAVFFAALHLAHRQH
ncbi:hypothetical protein [Roseiconus lacunae]|uniref:hypothetical protein n=1 Tax=Roseiconus lacunae TaxID=2605694 RepID=UPI001E4DAB96|nr:hypothetical protein [Roseiconus lacunae]